jgi:crotonobetainyl-CoA:carnitine CoA-transferase CaiB-like acyl-CoA transferase
MSEQAGGPAAPGPLDGVRVLELIRVAPGAFCTMMLADMGADVVKIETPNTQDPYETGSAAPQAAAARSAFRFIDRNKRSVAINLKDPKGQALLQRLAEDADVLVEGFRPGVMARLGGDYETLRKRNPRLIYCSLSGFGQTGPYRNYPGHDINYLSIAGVLDLIGEPGRPPAIPLNLVADYAGASMHGVQGILLALLARARTGRGQQVDVSYLDTTLSLLAATPHTRDSFRTGRWPVRGGGGLGGSYPYYSTYETSDDKLISIGCTEPWLWANFCRAVGRPDLESLAFKGSHFLAPADEAAIAGKREVQAILRTKTRDEWFDFLKDKDVCVGPVNTPVEAFDDPHVRARQMVVDIDDPRCGTVRQTGIAIKLSETPGSIRRLGPMRGEHTDEILAAIGCADDERAALREAGTIG